MKWIEQPTTCFFKLNPLQSDTAFKDESNNKHEKTFSINTLDLFRNNKMWQA